MMDAYQNLISGDKRSMITHGSCSWWLLPYYIVHNHWEAFLQGIPKAGVNLLRILSLVHLNINAQGELKAMYYFQNRMEFIIEQLNLVNHPAGKYYETLSLMYEIMDTGTNVAKKPLDGLSMMCDLADDGNVYADAWLTSVWETIK